MPLKHMSLFVKEYEKERSALGFKNKRKSVKRLPQTGKSVISRDKTRDALVPGKRVSRYGKTYWETRKNRSDNPGSRV